MVAALYRRIESIARLTAVLWGVMLICVGTIIVATLTNFDPALAFDFPSGAFELNGAFFAGLGGGLLIAVYDYLGYFTVAYMGEELREPGRVMPRAIVWSITGIMVIYLALNIGVMGVLPWKEVAESESIASLVMEHTWGKGAAQVITALVVVTAFASVFAGLLGGSRVPFNAARDRLFLPVFGRLHPRLNFPHVALLVMGAITAAGSFFELETVLQMFTAVAVLVQSLAQVAALTVLRRRQPGLKRPYRQWLYPVPSLLAVAGWVYVYYAAGASAIWLSLAWIAFGVLAFLVWARVERTWPFGPKEIREKYLAEQGAEASPSS
ncbi:APC family permease [Streptomyces bathyalis]|uniref:APC family permease n=1 Tax=Streptomyces bathyalis TaxID=2710756 RepID=UPI0031B5A3D8